MGFVIPSIYNAHTGMVANAQFVICNLPHSQPQTQYVPTLYAHKPNNNSHPDIEGFEYLWDIDAILAVKEKLINNTRWKDTGDKISCSLYGKALGNKVFFRLLYDNTIYRVQQGVFYVEKFDTSVYNPKYDKFDAGVLIESDPNYQIALFFNLGD